MANPTSAELLRRVSEPDHESQDYIRHGRHGKELDTCVHNGYSYHGNPVGSHENVDRQRHARSDSAGHSLHEWVLMMFGK